MSESADEPAYVPDLEAAGYVLRIREPDWFEHRLLRPPDRAAHLDAKSDVVNQILARAMAD